MIHQYKNNGYNIVLDVNSGSIHVVDDVVYDVLSLMDEENADRYGEAEFSRIADVILKNDYKEEVTKEDLKDVFSDLQEKRTEHFSQKMFTKKASLISKRDRR